jgi:hypothetical protein
MELQKINIKIYGDGSVPELVTFIPVFHNWIQNKSCEELLIDVADYSHVPAGPGVVLIADECNYSVEYGSEEKFGLLYNTKEVRQGDNESRIRHAVHQALKAAVRMEGDERLRDLKFPGQLFRLIVNSRDLSNNDSTFQSMQNDLNAAFDKIFGDSKYSTKRVSNDGRERLTVEVMHASRQDLHSLLGRIR